jgi:hypothetical protein
MFFAMTRSSLSRKMVPCLCLTSLNYTIPYIHTLNLHWVRDSFFKAELILRQRKTQWTNLKIMVVGSKRTWAQKCVKNQHGGSRELGRAYDMNYMEVSSKSIPQRGRVINYTLFCILYVLGVYQSGKETLSKILTWSIDTGAVSLAERKKRSKKQH